MQATPLMYTLILALLSMPITLVGAADDDEYSSMLAQAKQLLVTTTIVSSPTELDAFISRNCKTSCHVTLTVLYEELAAFIAQREFLLQAARRTERKLNILPYWLFLRFNGFSIQDLNDHQEFDPIKMFYFKQPGISATLLTFAHMQLNSLVGLATINIPQDQTLKFYLQHNILTTIAPDTIQRFPRTEELHIHNNRFTTLTAAMLAGLTQLRVLKAHNNAITTIEPGTFTSLKNLHDVWLCGNPIAHDKKERERVEQEIKTATEGTCTIHW
jgi:hypothetical protein